MTIASTTNAPTTLMARNGQADIAFQELLGLGTQVQPIWRSEQKQREAFPFATRERDAVCALPLSLKRRRDREAQTARS